MSDEKAQATGAPDSAASALSAGLEMPRQPAPQMPQEAVDAMTRMAGSVENPKLPDEIVWMNIYCAVANCFNSEKSTAVGWADEGVREFRKRFRL